MIPALPFVADRKEKGPPESMAALVAKEVGYGSRGRVVVDEVRWEMTLSEARC